MSKQDERLLQIERSLANIDKTLALNTQHLSEHMRRTELIESELKPVVKHVQKMQGAGGLLAILALIATIASVFLYLK